MENQVITNEAQALLAAMLKCYKKRCRNGVPASEAIKMGDLEQVQVQFSPKGSKADVFQLCRQLHRAGLLKCLFASGSFIDSFLTDTAIATKQRDTAEKKQAILSKALSAIGEILRSLIQR